MQLMITTALVTECAGQASANDRTLGRLGPVSAASGCNQPGVVSESILLLQQTLHKFNPLAEGSSAPRGFGRKCGTSHDVRSASCGGCHCRDPAR